MTIRAKVNKRFKRVTIPQSGKILVLEGELLKVLDDLGELREHNVETITELFRNLVSCWTGEGGLDSWG